jgi:RNA polymerase-binding transcription factor DksA
MGRVRQGSVRGGGANSLPPTERGPYRTSTEDLFGGRGARRIDRAGRTNARPLLPKSMVQAGDGRMRHEDGTMKTDRKLQSSSGAFMARDPSARQKALRYLFRERRRLLALTCAAREGSPDLLELAQEIEEERVWLAVLDRSYAAQLELDRAIELLSEERYGRCTDCDRRIPPGRLHALPFAIRCVVCQERHEACGVASCLPA